MAKVTQVNLYSVIDEVQQSNTKFNVNGWQGVVAEVVHDDYYFDGTLVYFPGVTFKELKAKK